MASPGGADGPARTTDSPNSRSGQTAGASWRVPVEGRPDAETAHPPQLSMAAQLRALRDHARKNDYMVVREFVDEAESGRIADRPQFRRMIDEASRPQAPFREILVWKFSRFTRKREHAVAFKSLLRRKGVRVVSITEHADDTPTGKLMEAIIESVDEFYSENLAQEVTRGMREAASRGFWVGSTIPYGYSKVMVKDGAKKRPTLEPDPDTSPVVKRIFDLAEAGKGMLNTTRTLNDEGIASPTGKLWSKNGVHYILKNEVYTGAMVWGNTAKDKAEPVRVEKAFPAIITKAQFRRVGGHLRSRAPKFSHPGGSEAPTCSAAWSSARRATRRSPAGSPRAVSTLTTSVNRISISARTRARLPRSTPAVSRSWWSPGFAPTSSPRAVSETG